MPMSFTTFSGRRPGIIFFSRNGVPAVFGSEHAGGWPPRLPRAGSSDFDALHDRRRDREVQLLAFELQATATEAREL
jgi:hypothetical protein